MREVETVQPLASPPTFGRTFHSTPDTTPEATTFIPRRAVCAVQLVSAESPQTASRRSKNSRYRLRARRRSSVETSSPRAHCDSSRERASEKPAVSCSTTSATSASASWTHFVGSSTNAVCTSSQRERSTDRLSPAKSNSSADGSAPSVGRYVPPAAAARRVPLTVRPLRSVVQPALAHPAGVASRSVRSLTMSRRTVAAARIALQKSGCWWLAHRGLSCPRLL